MLSLILTCFYDDACRDWKNSATTAELYVKGRFAVNKKTGKENVDLNRDFPYVSQMYFNDMSLRFDRDRISGNETKVQGKSKVLQAKETQIMIDLMEDNIYDYKFIKN